MYHYIAGCDDYIECERGGILRSVPCRSVAVRTDDVIGEITVRPLISRDSA